MRYSFDLGCTHTVIPELSFLWSLLREIWIFAIYFDNGGNCFDPDLLGIWPTSQSTLSRLTSECDNMAICIISLILGGCFRLIAHGFRFFGPLDPFPIPVCNKVPRLRFCTNVSIAYDVIFLKERTYNTFGVL